MKSTATLLGLLLAALAVTALAEDKPAAPALIPPAVSQSNPSIGPAAEPAVTPLAEPKKTESAPAAPPATPPTNPVTTTTAPVPFTPLANGKVDDPPADPNVMQLPKMVVKQKPRPRLTPEIMVTRKAFGEDLAKQKFSALDQALNKFTLPLFGTSLAERALEDYEREKKEQLNADVQNIAKALETTDPNEAKSLKAAAARP